MPHKSDTKNVLPDAESVPVLASSSRDSRLLPVHTHPPLSGILARPAGSFWLHLLCSILQERGSHWQVFEVSWPRPLLRQGLLEFRGQLCRQDSPIPLLIKLVPQSRICVKAKNIWTCGHSMSSPGPVKESCIVRCDSIRGEETSVYGMRS